MSIDPEAPSTVPLAPPTKPRPMPAPPSRWPTVLAVIAIVYGAICLLTNASSLLSIFMVGMYNSLPPQQQGFLRPIEEYRWWLRCQYSLGALFAILLVIAGVGFALRARWSVLTARAWAMGKVLFVPFGVLLGFIVQRAQYEAMQHDPAFMSAPGFGPAGKMMDTMAAVTGVFSLVFGCVFPIFVLIWFSRGSIRSETAGWKGKRRSARSTLPRG